MSTARRTALSIDHTIAAESNEAIATPDTVGGADAAPAWLTYETFYGLDEQPFSLTSDPAFFYASRAHAATRDKLVLGIRRRQSLSVLTGDVGLGKTTLCRTVVDNLDRKTFAAFVSDPFASREDLLKIVLADFGVVSTRELSGGHLGSASRTELSFLLAEFLRTLSPLQAFAVVFIDEAQNLSPQLLEEIRILSDSDGRERQLQIVLVGQPELRDKLRLHEMRQVAQRISVRCNLEPLDREGVAGYIAHRLAVAGGAPDRVRFSDEAIAAIYEASGGVPRLINRLCDQALHDGCLQRASVIDRRLLDVAIQDIEPDEPGDAAPESIVTPSMPAPPKPDVPPAPAAVRPRPLNRDAKDAFDASAEWFAEFDARVNEALQSVAAFGDPDVDEQILEPIVPPQAPSVDAEALNEYEPFEDPPVVLRPSFTPNRGHS